MEITVMGKYIDSSKAAPPQLHIADPKVPG